MCQKPLSPKPGVLSYPFTTPPHLSFRWIGAKHTVLGTIQPEEPVVGQTRLSVSSSIIWLAWPFVIDTATWPADAGSGRVLKTQHDSPTRTGTAPDACNADSATSKPSSTAGGVGRPATHSGSAPSADRNHHSKQRRGRCPKRNCSPARPTPVGSACDPSMTMPTNRQRRRHQAQYIDNRDSTPPCFHLTVPPAPVAK